jgi:hypothetical protein
MFYCIHPVTIDVSFTDPVLVDLDQSIQNIEPGNVEFLQAKKITVYYFIGIAPVPDLPPSFVAIRLLKFDGPAGIIITQSRPGAHLSPETKVKWPPCLFPEIIRMVTRICLVVPSVVDDNVQDNVHASGVCLVHEFPEVFPSTKPFVYF